VVMLNTKKGGVMVSDKNANLQETFLNSVRKEHTAVTVFLINGVKLQGIITWFDNFCLLLKRDQHVQLVYKHAISTIMPSVPVNFDFDEKVEETE
jgi:host factor-I protein